MPSLENYKEENFLKLLLIGESGTGKTGALASLAAAVYKLRLLDFDSGLDILPQILSKDKAALARVEYETCTDEMTSVGGKIQPKGLPKGFSKAMNLMTKWSIKNGASEDLGRPCDWGRDTILVVDSLTHMGNAALRRVQTLNANPGGKVTQPEWGSAQNDCEAALALLYGESFKCNVIVTAHVRYVGGEKGKDGEPDNPQPLAGHPNAPGKALSPKIPSYFNTMLLCKIDGVGRLAKRKIFTVPDGLINVKQPFIMDDIPAKLSIETGLAEFFETALGKIGE